MMEANLSCPFCGSKVRVYKCVPIQRWSITFQCQNKIESGFNNSHREWRSGTQEEYNERIINRFETKVVVKDE